MTIAEKVRGILAQRPLTKAEVVAILGITNSQARSSLNELCKAGMVVRDGEVYSLGREKVMRTPMTQEKALARYERNRRAKGQRPRAEYLAELAATREARNKAKLARRAEREREKRAAAAAVRPPKVAKAKAPRVKRQPTYSAPKASKSRPANQQPSIFRSRATALLVQAMRNRPEAHLHNFQDERPESVDEWMARTGGVIERIPAYWEIAA